jgi:two-component system, chemotaxis family, CheB/CheR fusion protein
VKNMLTAIGSMATETLGSGDAASQGLLDRLNAMTRSYELVSRDRWGVVSLRDVVLQGIEPYRSGRTDNVAIDGPDVALKPKVALSLAMIVHELGANSVKHGSLSLPGGSLKVSWATESHSRNALVLDWVERGGPPPSEPRPHGFGLALIEGEVSHRLGGKAKIELETGGLRANFRIPLDSA